MLHHSHGRHLHQTHFIRQHLFKIRQLPLSDLLCPKLVQEVIEKKGGRVRDCFWSPVRTLYTFLDQVLDKDHSCRQAVARQLAWLASRRYGTCSPGTGPYCKARQRLPRQVPMTLAREVGQRLHQRTDEHTYLQGRPIKIIDGSTVSMPDTPANQQTYPQANTQKPGLGFPVARIVALISLSCGAVLDIAVGPYKGKQTGETALFRSLWHLLHRGDVVLGDCYFGSFVHLTMLRDRGVDSIVGMHQKRKVDFRKGQRLGHYDHIVSWFKPTQKPMWMDLQTYQQLPDEIKIREVKIMINVRGFRVTQLLLATTLLGAQTVSYEELANIYRARWHAELDLRSIKSVMQMDILRCKTPDMVCKEIAMHMLAYNLVRTVMAQSAKAHHCKERELSFTGALQTLRSFEGVLPMSTSEDWPRMYTAMLKAMSYHRVANRPDRWEPREVKRRAKPHKIMTIPRKQAKALLTQTT